MVETGADVVEAVVAVGVGSRRGDKIAGLVQFDLPASEAGIAGIALSVGVEVVVLGAAEAAGLRLRLRHARQGQRDVQNGLQNQRAL